jgi:hypothetical protein
LDVQAELAKVKISTVDAFQGAERKYIILTTVRTTESAFLSPNRTNVALTRAMNQLFIIGHSMTLKKDSLWANILTTISRTPGGVQSAELFLMEKFDMVLSKLRPMGEEE